MDFSYGTGLAELRGLLPGIPGDPVRDADRAAHHQRRNKTAPETRR